MFNQICFKYFLIHTHTYTHKYTYIGFSEVRKAYIFENKTEDDGQPIYGQRTELVASGLNYWLCA